MIVHWPEVRLLRVGKKLVLNKLVSHRRVLADLPGQLLMRQTHYPWLAPFAAG